MYTAELPPWLSRPLAGLAAGDLDAWLDAFAEDAVLRFFAAPRAIALPSFRTVFEAVRDGGADAGVVPVESSLLGTIRENLDLLWSFDLPIAGEVSVPVRLALLGTDGPTGTFSNSSGPLPW